MTQLAILGGDPLLTTSEPARWPILTDDDIALVTAMLRRGEIAASGAGNVGEIKALEDAYRARQGAGYALAVNSGTSALHSAFFGLELHPGDEVIAPALTFMATAMPLFLCNAVPVLADVDPDTGQLDPAALAAAITPRTRAIVVTHTAGYPADMPGIMAVARRHGLRVVEDAAQAHGAVCAGLPVGRHGDVAAFSMQANKQVTAGEGGILFTDDQRIYERAVLLGHCLGRGEQDVTSAEYGRFGRLGFGLNYSIHPIAAALARNSLARLDTVLDIRNANAARLDELIAGIPGITPPVRQSHVDKVAPYLGHLPLYRADELGGLPIERFVEAVRAEGVPLTRPASPPLHREPAFQDRTWHTGTYVPGDNTYRVYDGTEFPGVDAYLSRALKLPTHSVAQPELMAAWAAALRKVAENADQLMRRPSDAR